MGDKRIALTLNSHMASSSTSDPPKVAVEIADLYYNYGFSRWKFPVLQGIALNVPAGTIYGLLGPSGCGKTTLLKCVAGTLNPASGVVKLFGSLPGSKKSGVPGSGVGYMPQEIALYRELTIKETLLFFGRVHFMKRSKVKSRTDFLLGFLNLPRERKLVKNLSGGQQRRVSFAVALLHEPPLLILDEPTVGVDPVLRLSIWEYLLEICLTGSVTVIITTHYIEEARQANYIGLMRRGKILAEGEPLFQFLSPAIQVTIFCSAIGGNPRLVDVAVLNEDMILGVRYLDMIDKKGISQIALTDANEAEEMVLNGDAWALISIGPNFTGALIERFVLGGILGPDFTFANWEALQKSLCWPGMY